MNNIIYKTKHTLYRTYYAMKYRCNNPKFITYYEKNISVCDRWLNSFENFVKDMGPKPTTKHQLDRIDNDGNYEPSNCRWSTPSENMLNRSIFKKRDLKPASKKEFDTLRFYLNKRKLK